MHLNSRDTSKEAVMSLSGAASDLCVLNGVCQHLSGAITETLQGPHSAAPVTVSLRPSLPHPSAPLRAISVDPEVRRDPEPVEDSVLLLSGSAEEGHVLQSTAEGNFEKKGTAFFFTREVAKDVEQIHSSKTKVVHSCHKKTCKTNRKRLFAHATLRTVHGHSQSGNVCKLDRRGTAETSWNSSAHSTLHLRSRDIAQGWDEWSSM